MLDEPPMSMEEIAKWIKHATRVLRYIKETHPDVFQEALDHVGPREEDQCGQNPTQ